YMDCIHLHHSENSKQVRQVRQVGQSLASQGIPTAQPLPNLAQGWAGACSTGIAAAPVTPHPVGRPVTTVGVGAPGQLGTAAEADAPGRGRATAGGWAGGAVGGAAGLAGPPEN